MSSDYRKLEMSLKANDAVLERVTADRKALQEELVKVPLSLYAEIGRSVINKSWIQDELYGLNGDDEEEFPAGKELDWVRYPFTVKGVTDNNILLKYSKAKAGLRFNSPSGTLSAEVSLDVLSMSDREFASMVREEIRQRKSFLAQRAKAEKSILDELDRTREEIKWHELQIVNLRKERNNLLANQLLLRQD